jgi:hypothetical protein
MAKEDPRQEETRIKSLIQFAFGLENCKAWRVLTCSVDSTSGMENSAASGSSLKRVRASAVLSLAGAKPSDGCKFPPNCKAQNFCKVPLKALDDERPLACAPFATLESRRATNLRLPPTV